MTYSHISPYYRPHNSGVTCRSCHTANTETIAWPFAAYMPDCAGCHAGDYKASVGRHSGLSQDRNCGGSGCHRSTSNEW